ncbi:unnamed protein product, partial [Choristocarpus tenellus]
MKIATSSIATFLLCANTSKGHLFLLEPFSRNYLKTKAFEGIRATEHCPHCLQGRGVGAVRARAEKNTDPDWLASYGEGRWPLKYLYEDGMVAENGNYLEPEEIAVRHGVCGDPSQGAPEGDNRYGIANSDFEVIENYEEGSIIEIKTMTSTYHWGHIEYFICDAKDLADPNGPVTQECFNKHPLTRAPDDEEASPIDPAHSGRYFLDPMCRAAETDQTVKPEGGFAGQVSTMRYLLPAGLTCDRCILQMVYYTGNSCNHPGYREFMSTSVPKGCAPNKDDWINPANFRDCGDGDAYPEEFWNCADISIGSSGGNPSPAPMTTGSPVDNISEGGVCAKPYEQCGGEGWTGADCCEMEYECESLAPCYSQCRPAQVEVKKTQGCKKKWEQCAGKSYTGAKCCDEGLVCVSPG